MSSNDSPVLQQQNSFDKTAFPAQFRLARPNHPFSEAENATCFPSPAETQLEKRLDLNEHLLRHPLATFFMRVSGDAMIGEKIYDRALLVVDRAEEARHGQVVVAVVNGEFCVRRLAISGKSVRLCAANPAYPDIELTTEDQWEIWGRVIYSINWH